ncbi:ABC transporter ATP-binding protein [Alterisphingorhabdus coralli]|uniref:ABC transporter ATP-binding protein n=1 Tax=Alterisphingorhabdus coralli TaxID=3071408 RepID=A0AA97F9F2_9SPHN|nr:ABC transporter ATP-binding protein [Parasphingorhabdus sp. SCSIO 66989]WOE75697.1 ABC transporter ATP-binding protein [Parasphingorhabdus sp. SCSIO 66989]
MTSAPPLVLESLGKTLPNGRQLFANLSLTVSAGECVSIQGESGIGKSTLLNLAAGLDTPSAGMVEVAGRKLADLSEADLTALRGQQIGFVFQSFHVLPYLTLAQNVALPAILSGDPRDAALTKARTRLSEVGLGDRHGDYVAALSGGELQRVAIARALVHDPVLILADEPTGNLDPDTSNEIMDLLARTVRSTGAAMVLVTHSPIDAAMADRQLRLTASGMEPIA